VDQEETIEADREAVGGRAERRFAEALRSLVVLREDPFLSMQASNLGLVDTLIVDIEDQVLREYMETDRTPMPTAAMASALSQLWIFGVYELLRTSRQRMKEIIDFTSQINSLSDEERLQRVAERREDIQARSADLDWVEPVQAQILEKAVKNADFAQQLRTDLVRLQRVFRKIETLRVHLAKHEIPRVRGSYASGAGYGRIDMENGSIYWQVELRNNEIDIVSRRDIAKACLEFAERRPIAILPDPIQVKVAQFPEHSYGVKRVILVLNDGRKFESLISWNQEILFALGFEKLPFATEDVIDARNATVSGETFNPGEATRPGR